MLNEGNTAVTGENIVETNDTDDNPTTSQLTSEGNKNGITGQEKIDKLLVNENESGAGVDDTVKNRFQNSVNGNQNLICPKRHVKCL